MKKIIAIIAIAFVFQETNAQPPRVDIPGSEVRKLTSAIVEGQEYELHIMYPPSYHNSNRKFPVIYLMDSQWDFPLVKSILGQQYYDGFVPELMIVGITWANGKADSLRARDYTPTHENSFVQSGGADKFLSFMKKELFPFIESNYKADSTNRTLMGCSFGGLVTLYALFAQPQMFTNYIAASPAIGWNKNVIYDFENAFGNIKRTKPARLYMTVGDVEYGRNAFEKFARHLEENNHPRLSLRTRVLENTGHSGTKSETYSRGMQFVFERPDLSLDEKQLDLLTGLYKNHNGNIMTVEKDGGKLRLRTANGNIQTLHASSETEFYAKTHFLKISFQKSKDKIDSFELADFGSSEVFKKMNQQK